MALSTYLVLADSLEQERSEANRATPIFHGHGSADPMVLPELGEIAARRLEQLGYELERHTYPMGHEVCPDEVAEIGTWLNQELRARKA